MIKPDSKKSRSIVINAATHRRARIMVATKGGNLRDFTEALINSAYETFKQGERENGQSSAKK